MIPLAVLLLSLGSDDGRGAPGLPPEEVPAVRQQVRVRGGADVGLSFGVSTSFSLAALAGGQLGMVVADRASLYLRAMAGSLGFSFSGVGTAHFEWQFNDVVSAGLGLGFTFWVPVSFVLTTSPFVGMMFPVRMAFALSGARAVGAVARSGVILGIELAPGFSTQPSYYLTPQGNLVPPAPGFTATGTLSYAFW